jgi:tetratricopeptide (TPR) repeat protein
LIYGNILAAQLNLGLVDDALETLLKITNSPETYTNWHFVGFPTGPLGSIVLYVHKHKTPEEASRIEAEAFEMFKNADGAERRPWNDRHLANYYFDLAIQLMQNDEAEHGARYLAMAFEQAEKEQARREEEAGQRLPFSFVESFCWRLAVSGELDKAIEIADRFEDCTPMPHVRLTVAQRYESMGETEKARAALKKAFETISQIEEYTPRDGDHFWGMGMLAVKLDEKTLFYEIVDTASTLIENHTWMLRDFTRQLAVYGDKEHPLLAHAEKYIDDFQREGSQAELYLSLGVSFAMLGDHDNARRLLRKGLMQPQERFMSRSLAAAVIEARSYEKQSRNL